MRATTRRQIKPFNLNQSQLAFTCRLLSQRQLRSLIRSDVENRDRSIFPDHIVRELNCAFDYFCSWIIELDVDFARRFHHAKTSRRSVEERDESLRENVLAGVLLYVVQASSPIDSPAHDCITTRRGALDHMKHAVVAVVDALNHTRTVERSSVARLSAARWIKRRAIENHRGPTTDALSDIYYASFKLDQMRIGIIETFCYWHKLYPQITQIFVR